MERIQRKRTPNFKLPKKTICVNRGTKWGNPFKVTKDLPVEEAIKMFKECVLNPHMAYSHLDEVESSIQYKKFKYMSNNLKELLKYKYIACFCPLNKPCHGDVLIELAKQEQKGLLIKVLNKDKKDNLY